MRTLKKPILDRYEQYIDGRIIIDVTASKIEDLFNNFDKTSPYIRKDLEPEFVDYLIECTREIGRNPFLVRLNIATQPEPTAMERAKTGILNYFVYLKESEDRKLKKMIRTSLILLGVGFLILILSIFVHRSILDETSIAYTVFAEGLTIAAWVSMWEALAMFIIQWPSFKRDIDIFRRISETSVLFGGTAGST